MRELLLVFNVKATSFLASSFDLRPRSLLKNISSLIIFGSVALGVFLLSRSITSYLITQAHIGQFLYHRFLSMLLYVFFITVNLGNMIVCYATLYRSEEVNFLMGLPVHHEKIFLVKFVDNFFYSSSTLTLLGLSWLLGYGAFFHMPWSFYLVTMFAVLIPFMLIAGLAAVITLMALIRVASRIGIRWLLAIVVTVYVTAIYLYFRITNPVQLVSEVMKQYPNVDDYFGYLDAPLVRYLPNHWVSEFLYWTINGDSVRAFPHFLMLIVALVTLGVAAALMARRYYYASWVAASDARSLGGERRPLFRLRFLEFGTPPVLSSARDVLVRRDLWMFLREPSQWLHLLLMLLLLVIFLVSVSSLDLRLSHSFMQVVTFLVVFLFNGFLVASVSLRFVFPLVSLEGESFWVVRSAPVSLRKIYWYKFLLSFLVVGALAQVLAVLSVGMVRNNPHLVILSSVCTGFVSLALTSMNLGAGTVFVTFREKNPIRIASTQGASLTFLISMIYLAIVMGVMVWPLMRYFDRLIQTGMGTMDFLYLPMVLVGVLSTLVFLVSTRIGQRAITRDI